VTGSRATISLALISGLIVVAGCGGKHKSSPDCAVAANRAAMKVVAQAFDAGKLGSRAKVQQALGGPEFFTKTGKLRLDGLSVVDRGAFEDWMRHDPSVLGPTGHAQDAAMQRVLDNCKS
jgi:hypothetical protein